MQKILASPKTARTRLPKSLQEWPEAYGITIGIFGYLVALAIFRPPWSTTEYPSKAFRLAETTLQLVVVITLILGAIRNRSEAPRQLKTFWLLLLSAYIAASFATLATMVLFQIAPLDYDRPGVILRPIVYVNYTIAALAILVTFGLLTAALTNRVRLRASRGRSLAIFLDATAGALSMATIGALIFTRPTQQASAPGKFIAVFVAPLGLIYTALLVMALALVALARASGLPREPEFCISVAMLLAIMAAVNFLYQSLNPDSTPRLVSVSYWIMIAGGLVNISERRTWRNPARGDVRPRSIQPLGATGPIVLAFVLPVVVVIAAGLGMRGISIVIAITGTTVVGAIVLYRLTVTVRENARLFAGLQAERERAEAFAKEASIQAEVAGALLERATQSQETERIELALRLHDEFLQGLSAIHVRLRTAMRKYESDHSKSQQLLDRGIFELEQQINGIRDLMGLLRPTVLEELGISAAIQQILDGCETAGFSTALSISGEVELSSEIELALYRICQEAIANAVAHSGSESIEVELSAENGQITLIVSDTGTGFEMRQEVDLLREGRVGLASMYRRAEMSGIELRIDSSPGQGCIVTACFPRGVSL